MAELKRKCRIQLLDESGQAIAAVSPLTDAETVMLSDGRSVQELYDAGELTGTDGAPGSIIHNVTGEPEADLGIDGDWALDTATGDLYQRTDGAWKLQMNLTGAKGEDGVMLLGKTAATATRTTVLLVPIDDDPAPEEIE